jgi:hypothetical protein
MNSSERLARALALELRAALRLLAPPRTLADFDNASRRPDELNVELPLGGLHGVTVRAFVLAFDRELMTEEDWQLVRIAEGLCRERGYASFAGPEPPPEPDPLDQGPTPLELDDPGAGALE